MTSPQTVSLRKGAQRIVEEWVSACPTSIAWRVCPSRLISPFEGRGLASVNG